MEVEEQQKKKKSKTRKAWAHSSCEWTRGGCKGEEADIQIGTTKLEMELR